MDSHAPSLAPPHRSFDAEASLDASRLLASLQAVRGGDFSVRLPGDWTGLAGKIADTFNEIVAANEHLAAELERVSEAVGKRGKTRQRVRSERQIGAWGQMESSVNGLIDDLLWPTTEVTRSLAAVAKGDLSQTVPLEVEGRRIEGEYLRSAEIVNTMIGQMRVFTSEVTRVAREVGTEGTLGGQAVVKEVSGVWKDLTDNVNSMASNLTAQVRNIAEVTTAVAGGDLSKKITVDVRGEILELKDTINTMVDQLNSFASEVTRVAREVGTEGKLGGQAQVPGVAGIWKDLTDNVNVMAANLTNQVRGIVKVVTAVANGDLTQKLTVQSQGEIAALADTINSMIDTLATFADQVTTVAREVGVEGRLGGQANVPGAAGTWKDLVANVNLLAANLTTQVRAIADVATAVTEGDLTRYIQVDAKGEVADLKNHINAMIGNLRQTTERNTEQDWLKTNLAKFSRMMQGQRDLYAVARMLLSELAPLVDAQQGAMYVATETDRGMRLRKVAGFADLDGDRPCEYALGEGLIGQCAYERHRMTIAGIPAHAVRVAADSIEIRPHTIMVLPVLFEGQVMAVIQLASLREFTPTHIALLEQLTDIIGIVLNTIAANMRTESLLRQSQQLATELQTQQRELQQTNEELAQKARLLAAQNAEVERKNREIEQARRALEEKAAELALTSRYKSEFLANMSHELRTPLNSILILGQQLAENTAGNLTPRQVEFARTIHAAGTDLLNLISDILDLSKIESGTVTVEYEELPFASLEEAIVRGFRHEAEARQLAFAVEFDASLGPTMRTDPRRLLQVLKNLLSNALKFTERGSVTVRARRAAGGWTAGHPILDQAPAVVAFSVSDTGIGIAPDKQKIIFEAFQQADAGTARQYGGTGLGLAISRELARLLGGEICLRSALGSGSTFTLYLPLTRADGESKPPAAPLPLLAAPNRTLPDDREALGPEDEVMLIFESDAEQAQLLRDLARERGFKTVVAASGADAVALARAHRPRAIALASDLHDTSGWVVLSQLKQDAATRHVPVQVMTPECDGQHSLARGAYAHLEKPATAAALRDALDRLARYARNPSRRLLVLEDGAAEAARIAAWLAHDDIELTAVASGDAGLRALRASAFDCVVLTANLADTPLPALLARLAEEPDAGRVPFVLFLPRRVSPDEETAMRAAARRLVLRVARTRARLLDETALFLHRAVADLPEPQRRLLERLGDSDEVLANRTVLVVDDDARNTFALSSVLESYRMRVVTASNGRAAIEVIRRTPELSLVLMDIMMPDMDGYETIRRIRRDPRLRTLPIVALTAKAMRGDREKCLEAGASDYIAKPVDNRQLHATLRMWLYR
ncbi:MAG TPA: response regulator [Burkholderiales bacterium]